MKNEALRLAIKAMKSFQEGTNGLYKGEFNEEIAKCEKALTQWVDLTPEDILILLDEHNLYGSKLVELIRATESKVKSNNV